MISFTSCNKINRKSWFTQKC